MEEMTDQTPHAGTGTPGPEGPDREPEPCAVPDSIRKLIEELRGEVQGRLDTFKDHLSGREQDLERRIDAIGGHLQELVDRFQAEIQKGKSEQEKLYKLMGEIGDRTAGILTGLEEKEKSLDKIGKKVKNLAEEVVTNGRQLTLMKGIVEKNSASFRELLDQGKKLLSRYQEQDRRLTEEEKHSREEEARHKNNQGVVLFYQGATEAAAEHFKEAVELHPDYPEAFNNLGLAQSRLGLAEQAVQSFQKTIQLDPKLAEAYNNLGFLYHSNLEFPKAVEMFRKALLQSGDFAAAYTNLGNSFYMLKRHDRALVAWKRAVEIDPLNENALRSLRMFDQQEGGNGLGGK